MGVNTGLGVLLDTFFYRFEDIAERSLYGFKPFGVLGSPQSLSEAAERGFYAMANTYRLDAGSQIFGDVSAIFSSKLMRKSALVSALDGRDRAIVIAESLARVVVARFESLAVIGGHISLQIDKEFKVVLIDPAFVECRDSNARLAFIRVTFVSFHGELRNRL